MKTKLVRGQLRQLVLEILPEVLSQEMIKSLTKANEDKIRELEKHVKATLKEISENHKDTMGYLVRQVTSSTGIKK